VQALPFVFSLLVAVGLTPLVVSRLTEAGLTRENYRGRPLPVPLGVVIVPVALIALIPVMLLARLTEADVYPDNLGFAIIFVPGVALLGLIDDVLSGAGRGWRGHGSDVMSGALSTGLLKAGGTLGLALLVASSLPGSDADFLLAAAVLVLATNAFNLLDLRPGRSVKGFVLLAIGLTIATQNTEALAGLGLFVAPVLVAGFYDLREKAMLGDTGSNLVGALAGLLVISYLGTTGQLIALILALGITIYGEFRSISSLVERAPLLRQLDSLGRVE
jgi:UDP-GlcNAc:undecaprenyl-phosphate/decaprenyl-phosphate GlcNAc-1-phosphate transferase